jgi:hypothetical protein
MVAKEISTIKKPITFTRTIGKIPWGYLRNWLDSTYGKLKGVKMYIHLKDFTLRRKQPEVLLTQSYLGNYFPKISFPMSIHADTQNPLQPCSK